MLGGAAITDGLRASAREMLAAPAPTGGESERRIESERRKRKGESERRNAEQRPDHTNERNAWRVNT